MTTMNQNELALVMTDEQLIETRERCVDMIMNAFSPVEIETADAILDAVEAEIMRRYAGKRVWS